MSRANQRRIANHSECRYAIHEDRVPVAGTRYTTKNIGLLCSRVVSFACHDVTATKRQATALRRSVGAQCSSPCPIGSSELL